MSDEPELETGVESAPDEQPIAPDTPGAKLRAAREAQGMSLQDIATRTRIAQRQLDAIEKDDYAALPGIPYAVGFARAYARTVGMDEVAIAADVREAVSQSELGTSRYEAFEPVDPARVPSRTLAWTAAVIAIVVVAGFAVWRTQLLTPPTGEEIAKQEEAPAAAGAPAASAPARPVDQTVTFTAIDDVWLRIYDEAGERLKDGLMRKGEVFTLPAGARNPMILTGRPQALAVAVGGKAIAPLGAADRTIADVPVSATALLARAAPVQSPAPLPAAGRPAARRTAPAGNAQGETPSPAEEPSPAAAGQAAAGSTAPAD